MNISHNKKVSVIVPNYNYGRYIEKRLETIVRQTYPVYELIVLDDKSTDNSVKIIRKKTAEIKRRFPLLKVKIVESDVNSGKAIAQWKKGVEMAKGDYIWIAEADDLCSRRFLEEAMKGFDDPEVVISYTESAIMNSFGLIIAPNFRWSRDREKTGHYKNSYVKKGVDEIQEIMAIRCTIPNVSAVVFRKTRELVKYMDKALKYHQVGDWYLYLRLLDDNKISYNAKSLNRFRIHGGSVTGKAKTHSVHLEEIKEIHEMIKEKYRIDSFVKDAMEKEKKKFVERMGNK